VHYIIITIIVLYIKITIKYYSHVIKTTILLNGYYIIILLYHHTHFARITRINGTND